PLTPSGHGAEQPGRVVEGAFLLVERPAPEQRLVETPLPRRSDRRRDRLPVAPPGLRTVAVRPGDVAELDQGVHHQADETDRPSLPEPLFGQPARPPAVPGGPLDAPEHEQAERERATAACAGDREALLDEPAGCGGVPAPLGRFA